MLRLALGLLALIIVVVIFMGGTASTDQEDTSVNSHYPSRNDLRQSARSATEWLFVYAAEDETEAARYRAMLKPFEDGGIRNTEVIIKSVEETPDSLLGQYPLLLVGTNWPAHWLAEISSLPAVEIASQSFELGNESFKAANDVLKLMFLPNPWAQELPISILTANSDAALIDYVERQHEGDLGHLFWSSWGYELHQAGQVRYLGYFADSSWIMDQQIHYAFDPEARAVARNEKVSFWAYDGAETTSFSETLLADYGTQYERIKAFCGGETDLHVSWYFYPTVEQKALRTNDMQQAHCLESEAVLHLVHNDYFRGEEWGEQFRPLLRHWLGRPASHVLEEGLLLYFSDEIRGRDWREWGARLVHSNSLAPLDELLNNQLLAETRSLITRFSAALWIDYLLANPQLFDLQSDYANWQLNTPEQIASLEQDWHRWLSSTYPHSANPQARYDGADLRGFTLTHEGYRIYNGYGSALARASLEELTSNGTNAIAIVPYSFMRNARKATLIPVVDDAGTENNEAILFSHFVAKDLGQFTLLKPQVWIGNGWPGDVDFETEEEFGLFFHYYEAWIKHYALLAELYEFDALCIGTELVRTTLKHPDRWRQIIRDIRGIYSGSLTYAANWGEECEQLSFWQDLDFIGVNCYYPLHRGETANQAELKAGLDNTFEKLAQIQQEADRPMWFTEVGFRSAERPWRSPHAEAENRAIDEAAQAQCYRLMLEKVRSTDWLQGIFWWKWPTYLHYNEDRGRGYNPYGKPAGDVLREFYQDWE